MNGYHALTKSAGLMPHRVFAIWCEDGTELLNWFLDEGEANSDLERLMQNEEPGQIFHLATYEMVASTTVQVPEDEYDPMDYDPENLM